VDNSWKRFEKSFPFHIPATSCGKKDLIIDIFHPEQDIPVKSGV